MSPLCTAPRTALAAAGLLAALSLALTACGTSEPTDGLGGSTASATPTDQPTISTPGGDATPGDVGDTSKIDVDALTAGKWYAAGRGDPYLEFSADGKVTGTDGCNRIVGTWSADGTKTITIPPFATTLMACSGVDTWLSGVSTVTFDGSTMTVKDKDGKTLGELTKKD